MMATVQACISADASPAVVNDCYTRMSNISFVELVACARLTHPLTGSIGGDKIAAGNPPLSAEQRVSQNEVSSWMSLSNVSQREIMQ